MVEKENEAGKLSTETESFRNGQAWSVVHCSIPVVL